MASNGLQPEDDVCVCVSANGDLHQAKKHPYLGVHPAWIVWIVWIHKAAVN